MCGESTFDVNGNALESNKVQAARAEELEAFRQHNPLVYSKVPVAECWATTGKAPIGVRFVDVNKGDGSHPN